MAAASTAGSMQREIDALKQALRERDEEVGRCHKRTRALTSPAPPMQMVAPGARVLDLLLTNAIVPYPKDTRPAFEGLGRDVGCDLRGKYRHLHWRDELLMLFLSDELHSCRTLCNRRAPAP